MNPDLKAKLESAAEHYEALTAAEKDRATYLLASMIVDETDPGKSIAELERIGEEKLRMIVQWIENAKHHGQTKESNPGDD